MLVLGPGKRWLKVTSLPYGPAECARGSREPREKKGTTRIRTTTKHTGGHTTNCDSVSHIVVPSTYFRIFVTYQVGTLDKNVK